MPSLLKRTVAAALILGGIWAPGLFAQTDSPGPESVVVVANAAFPPSIRVARAYMERRHIPETNLVLLETAREFKVSRAEFIETIRNPLLAELLERQLVEGLDADPDAYGREAVTLLLSKVRYLVMCYGIPYYITPEEIDEAADLPYRRQHLKGRNAALGEQFVEGHLARNDASVDGELALLLRRETPVKGFYPSPLFNNRLPGTVKDILRVTRLDGPSEEAIIGMLDNALRGEQEGLKGRAYIDEDTREGNYASGNMWIEDSGNVFQKLGFDLSADKVNGVFPGDARFDAPVLYAGWYANKVTGPFTLPGFRFPPGAVAVHLHSFSARTMRRPDQGWVGPFVARGVSATLGNVAEPYLNLTHQFSLFFAALASGWNFGDAAYMALPGLSWQAVAVGDPLYRPFATGLPEQLEALGDPARILEDQYVIMRQVNLLEQSGQEEEALQLAARGMLEAPGPALALKRALMQMDRGDRAAAVQTLSLATELPPGDWSDWGLLAEIADTLAELDEPRMALRIYQRLEKESMPEQVILAFLKRGIQAAEQAGEPGIAGQWQARVTPPPPPPEEPANRPQTGNSQ
mgnify:CR=1 FL=1